MRIITDLPDQQIAFLAEFCAEENISRAEAIRRAVIALREKKQRRNAWIKGAGIWKGKLKVDALEYQRIIREGGDIKDAFYD